MLYMNYVRTHDYSKSKTIGVIKLIAQASTKVIFRKVYLFINVFYVAVKQKVFSLSNRFFLVSGIKNSLAKLSVFICLSFTTCPNYFQWFQHFLNVPKRQW